MHNPSKEPLGRSLMDRFGWMLPLLVGALTGLLMRLIFFGQPGHPYEPMMKSFVLLVPMLVGAIAVYVAERTRRRTWSYYFWVGVSANALFVLGSFLVMIEGLICVILAIPLFGVIGGLSGLAMGAICRWTNWPKKTLYCVAVLPILLGGIEQTLPLPQEVRSIERHYIVSASPEQVWRSLTVARHISANEIGEAWMYRIGVPVPLSAITEREDGKQVRHITMGRGIHFDQVADIWQPNVRVRWTYKFSVDSFPPGALDDHVRIGGTYFDVLDTEYSMTPVREGTELRVRMHYRVGTAFNWYAGPIAAFLVGNFEEAALKFYSHRSQVGEAVAENGVG